MKEIFEELDKLGANTGEGITRLVNNEGLYVKCLQVFSKQAAEATMQEALDNKDYENLEFQTHSFKGTSGNLSLTSLFERYDRIVSDIRAKNYDQLQSQLTEVTDIQEKMCRVIDKIQQ